MGVLRAVDGEDEFELAARTLVGRAAHCELRLTSPRVSGEHAAISWSSGGWEVRDLNSRNGTFVEGRRLEPGERARISAYGRIAFGDPDAVFEWRDVAPPPASARTDDGQRQVARDGVLVLPSEADPQLTIFWRGGRWICEDEAGDRPAPRSVEVAGQRWHLELPHVLATTIQAGVRLAEVTLDLAVSRDEEHVEAVVRLRDAARTLPARAHHYLLAVLARLRLAQEHDGWVHSDDLTRMLALDRRTVNVQIFRARQEFGALGVIDASDLIQRRTGGLLRIGMRRLSVRTLRTSQPL